MIDQLREYFGESYGHESLQMHETHISWVILAGDRAFKIKKPICNPFLDYRTLEDRRRACCDELALNRRYAPDLYEAVVALVEDSGVQTAGGAALRTEEVDCDAAAASQLPAGTREVAVRMRRFAGDALLSQQLQSGRVDPLELERLARRVGRFHETAAVAAPGSGWGTAATVAQDQRDNVEYLRGCRPLPDATREPLEEVARWIERASEGLAETIESRRRGGFVRACHGDLHAENIVRWQDEWIPFDGIEFNEHLRWIDVQCDIAFTTMDLHARGHAELADRFANAYLEATGDYGGLPVKRYFEVYRAMVRAKVAAIRAEQLDESGEADGGEGAESARRDLVEHVELARRLIAAHRRCLCITHGLSGSGKTFGSTRYLERHGMRRVRSDVERKRLFAAERSPLLSPPPSTPLPPADQLYAEAASRATYDRLAEIAAIALQAEVPVIVDATFLKRHDRQRFAALAEQYEAEFRILAFEEDLDLLRQRVADRAAAGGDASDADLEVLEKQREQLEPLDADERARVVDAE
jgi:hypothetical protein